VPRGKTQVNGATRISQNGYHYTKTKTGWQLTHRLILEKLLGRPLAPGEQATFKDRDRRNLSPDNIVMRTVHSGTLQKRQAQLEARLEEIQAELDHVKTQIAQQESTDDLTELDSN
jgi:uncharacterized protein YaiI (UPF0178 family)